MLVAISVAAQLASILLAMGESLGEACSDVLVVPGGVLALGEVLGEVL
jgi:hypothetical protein